MSFEVPVRSVGRSRRPILAPPLIAAVVVAVALLCAPATVGPLPSGPLPSASLPFSPTASPLDGATTECRDLRPVDCERALDAAVTALGPGHPSIASAAAWQSLICGDSRDCPPSLFERSRPAGSVVFGFDDRSVAWVNVLWLDVSSRRFEDGTERLTAYVVRWLSGR